MNRLVILIITAYAVCGCNIQTTARHGTGTPVSDIGGNVAYAAAADTEQLSSYSTAFTGASAARRHNIEKASAAIDKQVINPGEVFSFNTAVGPTEKETGFKLARIFIKGKDAEGYGGGVCQVSSTLYNAAKAAGLTIVERHPHTKAVSYVPEGGDAATSYGYKDLRIGNDNKFPVEISSRIDGGNIIIGINKAG